MASGKGNKNTEHKDVEIPLWGVSAPLFFLYCSKFLLDISILVPY